MGRPRNLQKTKSKELNDLWDGFKKVVFLANYEIDGLVLK